jgi:hypothetical protein
MTMEELRLKGLVMKDVTDTVPSFSTLSLDSKIRRGNFKQALCGISSPPIFSDSIGRNSVVAKQTFYTKTVGEKTDYIPHDANHQLRHLWVEILCNVWSSALFVMTYDWMAQRVIDLNLGVPPFEVPQVVFVKTALAYEQSSASGSADAKVFLIEEDIARCEGGAIKFKKYTNNVVSTILNLKDPGDQHRAAFFRFAQHVQYFKTGKLVFVADHQGMAHSY